MYKKSIQNGLRRIFEETLKATFVQIKVRIVSNLVKCMFIVFADKGLKHLGFGSKNIFLGCKHNERLFRQIPRN